MKDDTKHLDDGGGFGNDRVGVPEPEVDGPYEYTIKLQMDLTAEKLVKAFGDSAPDDVRTLIIELEQEIGLWPLTILLGRYFAGEMKRIEAENPELFNKTDDELLAELTDRE